MKARFFFALAALLSSPASAANVPRASTDGLDPWVSVDASGTPRATITPVLTTVNGVATTISAAPASLTATTATQPDSKATDVSDGGSSFLLCKNLDGPHAPFCKPDNGSSMYVGETYYVTWDTGYLPDKNQSVIVQVDYVNATGGGLQAFHSLTTPYSMGSYAWTIDKDWLMGGPSNNVTLYLFPVNPTPDEPLRIAGPTVMVTNRPTEYYHQPQTKAPTGRDLYIGLPLIFGLIIFCVGGVAVFNRKHRKIGLGNVMGRKKGYSTGKSRSQRLGLRKNTPGAIELRDHDLTEGGQYRDVPDRDAAKGGRPRAVSNDLGSLAGSPTNERPAYFHDQRRI